MTAKQNPAALQAPDGSYYVTQTDGAGTLVTVGTPTLATGDNVIGRVKITDGTNVAAVKAASTAPVATDPATVVTISPNSAGVVTLGQATMANSVPVTIASNQAPPAGATYKNIVAGQATTVVKASAGILYSIVFNTAATATNTTNVYDNASTSGTIIATPAATTAAIAGTTLTFGPYGVAFANGLTIITATANGANMTVVYQ